MSVVDAPREDQVGRICLQWLLPAKRMTDEHRIFSGQQVEKSEVLIIFGPCWQCQVDHPVQG